MFICFFFFYNNGMKNVFNSFSKRSKNIWLLNVRILIYCVFGEERVFVGGWFEIKYCRYIFENINF